MQVLFTKIRQKNLDEVKRILGKHPEAVNEPSGPKPKKDHGQSTLQVALKIGAIEIADYLIDHGADVNFMEAEDDDPGPRMPVLFDSIIGTIMSLCYKHYKVSDESLRIMKRLLDAGADPNAITPYGEDALNCAVHHTRQITNSKTIYSEVQDEAWNKLGKIMDLLIDYGFDYEAWADRHLYPEPHSGPTSRELYFAPANQDTDLWLGSWQEMRDFMQDYFGKRNIEFT